MPAPVIIERRELPMLLAALVVSAAGVVVASRLEVPFTAAVLIAVGVGFAVGFATGRSWAMLAGLVWMVGPVLSGDTSEDSVWFVVGFALVGLAAPAAAFTAFGVSARRSVDQRRLTARGG